MLASRRQFDGDNVQAGGGVFGGALLAQTLAAVAVGGEGGVGGHDATQQSDGEAGEGKGLDVAGGVSCIACIAEERETFFFSSIRLNTVIKT
jgi:hypothetical protein